MSGRVNECQSVERLPPPEINVFDRRRGDRVASTSPTHLDRPDLADATALRLCLQTREPNRLNAHVSVQKPPNKLPFLELD